MAFIIQKQKQKIMTDNAQQNIDLGELAKFNELASKWWDKTGDFKPLHEINPLRLNYINNRRPLKGLKVLDVGCGGGILTESMAVLGADVTGIDMGDKALNVAKLHRLESDLDIDYQLITAEEFSVKHENAFDVVTCLEMLEHVPDPGSVIMACKRLVKDDGDVFLSTINRNPKAFLFAVLGAEYILNLLPKGTHSYAKFIKPSELNRWAIDAGLSLQDITGLHYDPLARLYSLGDGVDVNYLAHYRVDTPG